METFLIVVDMQNDFIDGSLGSPEAQAIVPRVQQRIEDALSEGRTVVFTQDTHESAAQYLASSEGKHLPVPHCVDGEHGWQIADRLAPYAGHALRKPIFSCMALLDLFRDIAGEKGENLDIALCGLCTDICVVSNALLLRGHFPEAKITVYADSSAGTSPERHQAALDVMRSCHIEIE